MRRVWAHVLRRSHPARRAPTEPPGEPPRRGTRLPWEPTDAPAPRAIGPAEGCARLPGLAPLRRPGAARGARPDGRLVAPPRSDRAPLDPRRAASPRRPGRRGPSRRLGRDLARAPPVRGLPRRLPLPAGLARRHPAGADDRRPAGRAGPGLRRRLARPGRPERHALAGRRGSEPAPLAFPERGLDRVDGGRAGAARGAAARAWTRQGPAAPRAIRRLAGARPAR